MRVKDSASRWRCIKHDVLERTNNTNETFLLTFDMFVVCDRVMSVQILLRIPTDQVVIILNLSFSVPNNLFVVSSLNDSFIIHGHQTLIFNSHLQNPNQNLKSGRKATIPLSVGRRGV